MSKRPCEDDDDDDDAPPAKRICAAPELPDRCVCIVCTEPRVQPFGCRSCFNSVCGACARRITDGERPTCPYCRNPVVYDRLVHDLASEVEERLGAAAYAEIEATMGPRPVHRPATSVPVVQRDGARVTVGLALDEGTAKISFTVDGRDTKRRVASFQLLPRERTADVQHIASSFDLKRALVDATHEEILRIYQDHHEEQSPWEQWNPRARRFEIVPFNVFADRIRTRTLKKVANTLAISFSGRTLINYLNAEYRNMISWLSVFRTLYPLVSDKENDIAELVDGDGVRREVAKIAKTFRDNRAIAAAAQAAAPPPSAPGQTIA